MTLENGESTGAFAGEVINIDGPSGGYNLQIAFSTGALAGETAAVNAF